MTRKIRPLISASSHLSFPSTSSSNITTKGLRSEEFYLLSNHSSLLASFGRSVHVYGPTRANNRNFSTVLHGLQNRKQLYEDLQKDSINFARDSSFPSLKSASTYELRGGRKVVCQNQLYENSFAVNTQRQTVESLRTTTPQFLGPIIKKARVDYSLNWICCTWEEKLSRNLSTAEKCQLIQQVSELRKLYDEDSDKFKAALSRINLKPQDTSWSKNLYSLRREKTCNPELEDISCPEKTNKNL